MVLVIQWNSNVKVISLHFFFFLNTYGTSYTYCLSSSTNFSLEEVALLHLKKEYFY